MQQLGHSRSAWKPDHLLVTPDTHVRAPLPGMKKATAIIHAAPALGAAFTMYTAELEQGGTLGRAYGQRFIWVLEGQLSVEINRKKHSLTSQGYAYLPEGNPHRVSSVSNSRCIVIEKPYQELEGVKIPVAIISTEEAVASQPLGGDEALQVRALLPAEPSFDFAVNTMTFQPGASLSMVEVHVMEHGLMMLDGGGIYRLGECWYPVTGGDFIWMAPYCPQWFGALGKTPARYLIYKDWNRHPAA